MKRAYSLKTQKQIKIHMRFPRFGVAVVSDLNFKINYQ